MINISCVYDKYLHNRIIVRSVIYLGYLSMILRVPQSHTEIGLLYASNSQLVTKPLLESINQNKQFRKNGLITDGL